MDPIKPIASADDPKLGPAIPLAHVTKHLIYRLRQDPHGEKCVSVSNRAGVSCDRLQAARELADAIEQKDAWNDSISPPERVVGEMLMAETSLEPFYIFYYSVGPGLENPTHRLSSFFILDHRTDEPRLPGFLEYPDTTDRARFESYFQSLDRPRWERWQDSFLTVHKVTPLLRHQVSSELTYVVHEVEGWIYPFPEGMAFGAVPIGSLSTYLALSPISGKHAAWPAVLDMYKNVFMWWNLTCRHKRLRRVLILGEPGAGKELWYKAIRGAAGAQRKGEWREVATTLEIGKLASLLYGEQSGNLERRGLLGTCEGGGIFLDEIGKSDVAFRQDLLRVLESREYVPSGGGPIKFEDIMFVFATATHDLDAPQAASPVDFWTRMDARILLPDPIRLSSGGFSATDLARFTSLFLYQWYQACLDDRQKTSGKFYKPAKNPELLLKAVERVTDGCLDPLLTEICAAAGQVLSDSGVSVSPRRVIALARSLSAEAQWLYPLSTSKTAAKEDSDVAGRRLGELRTRLADDLVRGILRDGEPTRRRASGGRGTSRLAGKAEGRVKALRKPAKETAKSSHGRTRTKR